MEEVIKTQTNENQWLLEELLKYHTMEEIAKGLLDLVCGKETVKENNKNEIEIKTPDGQMVKLFFNLGRKDNIKVKDFVGSIAANCGISGSDIGKINILDKFSFVEVPGEYVQDVVTGMKGKQVKGRECNVEIAEH